jgi:hypothetical protein
MGEAPDRRAILLPTLCQMIRFTHDHCRWPVARRHARLQARREKDVVNSVQVSIENSQTRIPSLSHGDDHPSRHSHLSKTTPSNPEPTTRGSAVVPSDDWGTNPSPPCGIAETDQTRLGIACPRQPRGHPTGWRAAVPTFCFPRARISSPRRPLRFGAAGNSGRQYRGRSPTRGTRSA